MGIINCLPYLEVLGSVPLVGVVAGYTDISDGSGPVATHASDQQGDDGTFDALLIHVTGIRVKPRDGEVETVDVHAEVDLTGRTDEASEIIDSGERDAELSDDLQVDAEAREATFGNGPSVTAEDPVEAPLKLDATVENRHWETSTFIADFTPSDGCPDGGGSATEPPPLSFTDETMEEGGQACGDVTATLQYNQDGTAIDVTAFTRIVGGENNTDTADFDWEGKGDVGTPEADATHITTDRVEPSPQEARRIAQDDGWITIQTTVQSDRTTITSQDNEQVA